MASVGRWSVNVIVTAACVVASGRAAPPEGASQQRLMIERLWSKDGDVAAKAVTALESDPLALPVLRRAMTTDPDLGRRAVLDRIARASAERRRKALRECYESWATAGRIDLLTEVLALSNGRDEPTARDHLLRLQTSLAEVFPERCKAAGIRPPQLSFGRFAPWGDQKQFADGKPVPGVAQTDAEIVLADRDHTGIALHGERVTVRGREKGSLLLTARHTPDHFSALDQSSRWQSSVVCVNDALAFDSGQDVLLVVDGDLDFRGEAPGLTGCLVLVNGNVTAAPGHPPRFQQCLVWAGGNIDLEARLNRPHESLFFARGKVANAATLAAKGRVEENVKEPPLPVRFLDPAEFGLTLEATKEGMKVAKVTDKSAFADGLKAGDVIARVGEVATTTAPAFRRELRRGVIEGAVLLDIIRGKEKIELLVAVPDVPASPKKKDDVKATPPEKK